MAVFYGLTTNRAFGEKYCLSASFLEFFGVTSAIRSAMKSLKSQDGIDQGFTVQKLIAATKPTKLAYNFLIKGNSISPQKSEEKWVKDCCIRSVLR